MLVWLLAFYGVLLLVVGVALLRRPTSLEVLIPWKSLHSVASTQAVGWAGIGGGASFLLSSVIAAVVSNKIEPYMDPSREVQDMTAIELEDQVEFVLQLPSDPVVRRETLKRFLEVLRAEVNNSTVSDTEYRLQLSVDSRQIRMQARRPAWGTWWKMDLRVITDDNWRDEGGQMRVLGTHTYGPANAHLRLSDAEDAGGHMGDRLRDAIDVALKTPGIQGVVMAL